MARRNLLAIGTFDSFKRWLSRRGFRQRPGKGTWQVLQVYVDKGWTCIFERKDSKEHYTIQDPLIPVVKQFIAERRKEKEGHPLSADETKVPLSAYQRDREQLANAARKGLKFNGRFLY